MFNKVKEFVKEAFKNNVLHFERTVFWLKKLNPNPDEALLIAAYSHDIQRAFIKSESTKKRFPNKKELKQHQERGGRIIYDYLLSRMANKNFALKVKKYIARHEVGGDKFSDLIKDAGSISYFENNALRHLNWIKEKGFTKKELRKKFDWMFDRITSQKAKRIAAPMYKKALKKLELN